MEFEEIGGRFTAACACCEDPGGSFGIWRLVMCENMLWIF
jgi:hypothetical protein